LPRAFVQNCSHVKIISADTHMNLVYQEKNKVAFSKRKTHFFSLELFA
jgi:hypothetical protein